ncbi:MAG: hypothetical protein WC356_05105 [Candidatus Micrarchaeia archaeon]|jgi:hypothetical protein
MKKILIFLACLMMVGVSGATDYSFGGDTTGTDQIQMSDSAYLVDTATTPAYSGDLDSAVIWLHSNWNSHSVAIIIYNADSTILDSTAHFSVEAASVTRYAASLVNKAAVGASTRYFIGLHLAKEGGTNGDGAMRTIRLVSSTVKQWFKTAQPVIPATVTAPSEDANGDLLALRLFYHDAEAPGGHKIGAAKLGAGKW